MCHWEPLGRALSVLVSSAHRFNTDTLLLADFSMPKPRQRCADLGSGCGTIPLLWSRRASPRSILALELDCSAVELMRRSVDENGLGETIDIVQGDLRDYKALLPHQALDLIACNPPYFTSGLRSQDQARGRARHQDTLTLGCLADAARFGLTYGGRLCICLPAVRLAEAIALLSGRGLEPKRLRLVQARADLPPYLFLLECRLGGGTGLQVEPNLTLEDQTGGPSRELSAIYGDYRENYIHGGRK